MKVGDRVMSTDALKVIGVISGKDGGYIYVTEDITEVVYEFYECELEGIDERPRP